MSHLGMSYVISSEHTVCSREMECAEMESVSGIWLDLLSDNESESISFMLPKDHFITYKYRQASLPLTGGDPVLLSQDQDCRLRIKIVIYGYTQKNSSANLLSIFKFKSP